MGQALGPQSWGGIGGTDALKLGLYFGGAFVRGGAYLPQGFRFDATTGAAVLASQAGNTVQQNVFTNGDMPVNANAMSGAWSFKIGLEEDYQRFLTAEARGQAVELWFDMPMADHWYIPGADPGATTWKTLRRQPWHLTGISHATRPPTAFVDGVEKTIVTSAPSAGEVQVLDSGGAIGTITTNTADTTGATWLELRYAPVFLLVVKRVSRTLANVNHITVALDFVEHLEGEYTSAVGG